ncbi:MAG: hypothetical protein JNJ45_00980 [Chthonomonas sp.]|nr:hypothetical protein [Chthonomonas sp.]
MNPQAALLSLYERILLTFPAMVGALSETTYSTSPGGVARVPRDIVYECAAINRRAFTRVCKTELAPPPEGSPWAIAPEGYGDKAAGIADFRASLQPMIELIRATEDFGVDVEIPGQDKPDSLYEYLQFIAVHNLYHMGQFAVYQSLAGDNEMHWG